MPEKRSTALYGTPLERYRLYREYLQHEDELIHQRLNWMLLLQGFLFAAYAATFVGLLGLLTKADASTGSKTPDAPYQFIQSVRNPDFHILSTVQSVSVVLPILGYTVALLSLFGVQAARNAIKQLEQQWKEEACCHQSIEEQKSCLEFPGITGGGAPNIEEMDSPLPFGIPVALCVAWTFLGIFQIKGPLMLERMHMGWWTLSLLLLVVPTGKLAIFALLRIASIVYSGYLACRDLLRKPAPLTSLRIGSKTWAHSYFVANRLPSHKNGLFHHPPKL